MGETLQSPQSIGIAISRFKDDNGVKRFDQPTLPGNAELGREGTVHGCYNLHGDWFDHRETLLLPGIDFFQYTCQQEKTQDDFVFKTEKDVKSGLGALSLRKSMV